MKIYGMLLLFITGMLVGCTSNKKFDEAIAKINQRLEALEKLVMPPAQEPEAQTKAFDIPVGNSFVLGKKDAPVSITVFSNFQCPYCGKADKDLRVLLNDPELKEKINIIFKHFPFERHVNARPASKAALAAGEQGNDKFWAMTEKNFANQSALTSENFEKWAKEIGLDVAKFKADLVSNNQKYDDIINADMKLGEEGAKLDATPWFLINGWIYEDDINAADIKKFIASKNL